MSFLDNLLLGIRAVSIAGSAIALPAGTTNPTTLNFVSGATGVYNTTTKAWDITISGGSFTAGGDLAGSSSSQQVVQLSGSSGTTTLASNLTPSVDNADAIGTASKRVSQFIGGAFGTYLNSGDAQPVAALNTTGLFLGAGGSTTMDTRLTRTAASTATLDNTSAGAATLNVGGVNASSPLTITGNSLSQGGTGAPNATAAGLTFTTQAVNATNGSSGFVVFNTPAPTGAGHGGQTWQEGGTAYAQIGPAGSGFYNFWLGVVPTATNAVMVSDGTQLYIDTPGAGTIFFRQGAATQVAQLNPTGFQLGGAASFGSGSGNILGIANATTACTTVPTGGAALWHDSIGLHYDGPSTSFTDYMLAPVSQGSVNSQAGKIRLYSGFARTTSTAAVTILTIPLATSGTNLGAVVMVHGRDVTAGTVGDGICITQTVSFKNVGGTVTASTTQATQQKASDTSLSSTPTLIYTISGTNILVQVTGITSVTIDWTATAEAITT